MKYFKVIVLASVTLALVFGSQPTVKAADVLHMYTALDPNEAKVYIEGFHKGYQDQCGMGSDVRGRGINPA